MIAILVVVFLLALLALLVFTAWHHAGKSDLMSYLCLSSCTSGIASVLSALYVAVSSLFRQ